MNVTDETRGRWINKCLRKGLCAHCGKEPRLGKSTYGYVCLRKIRRNSQKKYGFKPWRLGSKGRTPLEEQPKVVAAWVKKMRALCDKLERQVNK